MCHLGKARRLDKLCVCVLLVVQLSSGDHFIFSHYFITLEQAYVLLLQQTRIHVQTALKVAEAPLLSLFHPFLGVPISGEYDTLVVLGQLAYDIVYLIIYCLSNFFRAHVRLDGFRFDPV